jgi:hypothetical protein
MQLDDLGYQRRGATVTSGRKRASMAPAAPAGGGEGGST